MAKNDIDTDGGILPAKQLRSQRRQRAILDAAHRLLEEVGYGSMKMEDIAAEANSSVGTLYQRFRDKDGLLDVLLAEISETQRARIDAELVPEKFAGMTEDESLRRLTGLIVEFFRENPGFIRAVVARRMGLADGVSPLRPVAQSVVLHSWRAFVANFPHYDNTQDFARFRFGCQVVLSFSSNAVINRPGPVMIDDPALPDLLAEMLGHALRSQTLPLPGAQIAALDLSDPNAPAAAE